MKLKITQENLSRALGIVSRTASSRTTLPILSNILMKTSKSYLILSSTNLELSTTYKIPASIQEEGSTTIPAKLITEFVLNLPKTNIEINTVNNKMTIVAGGYKSTINTMSADDFPVIPEPDTKNKILIPTNIFKKAVSSTSLVASSDNTRPILTGVFLHTFNGSLYMAATDGYRLAEKEISTNTTEIAAIIPATTLNDVLRVLGDGEDAIDVAISDDQINFNIGDITINSRLIDGRFIDYRQLIPTSAETEAIVSRSELLRITKISELFARESAGSITINIDSKKSTLNVHSIASEVGENTAETEATTKGEGSITLNSKFLLDALNQIDSENVKIQFNGKLAPVLITAEDDLSYKHIVMPVKS